MERQTYIDGVHITGWIVGTLSFIGIWVYAFISWGFLFGLMFGWIPAIIGGCILGLLLGFLWPLVAVLVLGLVYLTVFHSDLI